MSSWSRFRKDLRSFIAPELRAIIDFHYTVYPDNWRLVVTLNSQEVFATDFWEMFLNPTYQDYIAETGYGLASGGYFAAEGIGLRGVHHNMEALKAYFNQPLSESRVAELPLIRALYYIDRRVGKRTLAKYPPSEDEHELVKRFYNLRKSVMVKSTSA